MPMTIKEWQALVKDFPKELAVLKQIQADAILEAATLPPWGSGQFIETEIIREYAEQVRAGTTGLV